MISRFLGETMTSYLPGPIESFFVPLNFSYKYGSSNNSVSPLSSIAYPKWLFWVGIVKILFDEKGSRLNDSFLYILLLLFGEIPFFIFIDFPDAFLPNFISFVVEYSIVFKFFSFILFLFLFKWILIGESDLCTFFLFELNIFTIDWVFVVIFFSKFLLFLL